MNRRLKKVAPLKAGIVLGILYAFLGVCIVPFFLLAGVAASFAARAGGATPVPFAFFFGFGAILFPLLYGAIGFVGGVLVAALYNLVAHWTGGLEFVVEDITKI